MYKEKAKANRKLKLDTMARLKIATTTRVVFCTHYMPNDSQSQSTFAASQSHDK